MQPWSGAAITRLVSLWLAIARTDDASDTVGARLAALLEVAAGVDDRLVQAGFTGVAGALEAYRRLAAVIAGVDASRLATLRAATASLERELEDAVATLARLHALKERLDALR